MRSHVTATMLVCAALFSAATAQTPTTPGMKGTLIETTVPSTNVPGPVATTYYLPKNYDANRAEPYPLLIQLHGASFSNKAMGDPNYGGGGWLLDQAIENGLVAPMVSVMPSAGLSDYMNYYEGPSHIHAKELQYPARSSRDFHHGCFRTAGLGQTSAISIGASMVSPKSGPASIMNFIRPTWAPPVNWCYRVPRGGS